MVLNPFIVSTQNLIAADKTEAAIKNLLTYTAYLKDPALFNKMNKLSAKYIKWKNNQNLLNFAYAHSYKNRLNQELLKVTTELSKIEPQEKRIVELKLDMSEEELDSKSQQKLIDIIQKLLGLRTTIQMRGIERG